MAKKNKTKDDTPPGGWLGPPLSYGVPAIGEFVMQGKGKRAKRVFIKTKLSKKDKKKRKTWENAVAKANKKGKWWFPNPFKKKGKKK